MGRAFRRVVLRSGKSEREELPSILTHSHRTTTQTLPRGIKHAASSALLASIAAYTFKIKQSQDRTHVNRASSYETECVQVSVKRGRCLPLRGDANMIGEKCVSFDGLLSHTTWGRYCILRMSSMTHNFVLATSCALTLLMVSRASGASSSFSPPVSSSVLEKRLVVRIFGVTPSASSRAWMAPRQRRTA